jgi:hypothetical protein
MSVASKLDELWRRRRRRSCPTGAVKRDNIITSSLEV